MKTSALLLHWLWMVSPFFFFFFFGSCLPILLLNELFSCQCDFHLVYFFLYSHIYPIHLSNHYFSRAKGNNTTRILKTIEMQRPLLMSRVLNKHHQNLRSRDQADKYICLANCFFIITQTLKIYSETPLVFKIHMQVDDRGNGGRDYLDFSI